MHDASAIDLEGLYGLIYEARWAAVLTLIHRHHGAVDGDPMLDRAGATFVDMFFEALASAPEDAFGEELEKLLLLHTAGFFPLSPARFETVVERLVKLHQERPEAALGFARFCPENLRCAAVIRAHGRPIPVPVAHGQEDVLHLSARPPEAATDATISLFKSQQEEAFFLAVREVFPTYLAYPNVALSSLVDYDAVQDRLSGKERQYFFRGLVDCVVFDQHAGYRPRFFFELDSPLHDEEAQQTRDRYKDHILAVAGQTLYRIRRQGPASGRAAFIALLKDIVAGKRVEEA